MRCRPVAGPWSYHGYHEGRDWRVPAGGATPAWDRAVVQTTTARPTGPAVFIHRDFHPGNLLWSGSRPDRRRRLGQRLRRPGGGRHGAPARQPGGPRDVADADASWPATRPGTSRPPSASSTGDPGRRGRGVAGSHGRSSMLATRPDQARGLRGARRRAAGLTAGHRSASVVAWRTASTCSSAAARSSTGPARPAGPARSSSRASGLRDPGTGCGAPGARRPRTIDATGKVVAPGLHRSPQPRRPGHPGRRPARAQGPPGRHDRGHRGRRERLRAVRATRDLEAFVTSTPAWTAGRTIDYDWNSVASYLARFDGTVSLNVATLVGNSQLRIAALGWDDVPADEQALDRMRGAAPRRDGRGRVRAQLRPRLPARRATPRPRSWRR